MTETFTCVCCGHRTLDSRYDWDICPVCFWEDDVCYDGCTDMSSPANHGLLISDAQANFMVFGACCREMLRNVRPPRRDEPWDADWQPLELAIEKARAMRGE